ncbi:MAG TPA: 2-oxoacid:acceptor oxidoreductase family protein [Candidatus Omnitrophota bacterium]|nr:2-oxoacid:acceptor oxidoreductase family protein [Candidatus Omnitrophota bacterium]
MTKSPKVKYPGIRLTTNGNQLVALHTEARLADAGIFYPITPSTEMGENFEMSFAKGELNVFGGAKIAIEAEGEHAAQGGAIAFSVTGKRVVNFTSGQGVVYGLEQYYHAPGKLSTMVLEVAARPFTKHALNVHCGHDDVYCALDTGWIILFAKDAQQAADQALILRKVTELTLNPGINAQDGFLTSHLERTFLKAEAELIREFLGRPEDVIDCPTSAQKELFGPRRRRIPENYDLKSPVILGPVQNQEHYMNGVAGRRNNFSEPILGFLENAYEEFEKLTGRRYGLISEHNTEKADTVFVSLGSSAENIEAAADYIRERDGKEIGVIHVNVLRPFPEAAIIRALRGKKNVVILERTDDQLAGDNPLTRDIRNALAKAEANVKTYGYPELPRFNDFVMPEIYSGVYGLGSRDFRPEGILGAYEFVLKGRKRQDGKSAGDGTRFFYIGINHPYAVRSDDAPSLLPEKSIAVRFHSIGGWGAITTGKNLSEILGELGDYASNRDFPGENREILHVSANPKYGSEKKGAPTNYFLAVAPERIRVNCDLHHVDVVLCCDPKAFTHTDPLQGIRAGGAMIWESSETDPAKAWQRIPKKYRKEIIEKNVKIYILDGFDIAQKATPLADLQLRMQGNSFLGAFFRVSSFLRDYRIPDEEFLRIVEAQYHKKFGKLGESVVQSNMTVMKEGFSRVRELPYGDMDAPDTSRMIGAVLIPCSGGFEEEISTKEDAERLTKYAPDVPPFHSRKMFDREFMAGLGYDQPASAYASTGVIAPATGKDMSKFVARRMVPKFIAEKCTQCMKCIVACPDTALPNTAQDIRTVIVQAVRNYVTDTSEQEVLLEAFSKIEPKLRQVMLEESKKKGDAEPFGLILKRFLTQALKDNPVWAGRDFSKALSELFAIVEKLPLAYSMAVQIFSAKEKKEAGSGGLFSIFVSDLCKGCGQCVVECGDHKALEMIPETDSVKADIHTGMHFLKRLPETSKRYLGLYNPESAQDMKAAVLQYHLMQQSKYTSLVSGEGACAGCGEKTVLHMLASVTEAYMRPLFHAKADRLLEKAKKLRESGAAGLSVFEKENPQGYAIFKRTVLHLLVGLGGETPEDTQKRIEREFKGGGPELIDAIAAVMERDAFNHRYLRAVEGMPACGMSVMGMTANTGCPTVYGSTPPSNPHPYPWMNSLFQDGATIGWLIAESFIMNHARRSVLPERFADAIFSGFKAANAPLTEEDYFLYTHFTDTHMTDREITELPKVWAVGGDGGLGDIGYQNLSKSILQNRPNFKVLMLDTQVYSNTGGQNSDSSPMPGGFDMNQFGRASQGKLTEKKEVAQSMTAGHGSAFVAQVSMANSAGLMKALIDALHYRGAAFVQAYTTCQPEHGVGDSQSTQQAQKVRDSRGFPEFIYNPVFGEDEKVCMNIKGNPAIGRDWLVKANPTTGENYFYTVAHWAVTENRFRNHIRRKVPDNYREIAVFLDDLLYRITQQDVVYRRVFNPEEISYIPPFDVYSYAEMPDGSVKPFLMSRQMVLFCVERRKNWRILQSRAGVLNEDYEAQKKVLGKFAKGEVSREDVFKKIRALIEAEKTPRTA